MKQIFMRSYQQQCTSEIFKVQSRYMKQNIPLYKLSDFLNEPIKGNFYQSELQKVEKHENTVWFIESIIRKRKRAGITEVLVKFEGWPSKYNQWLEENQIKEAKI